MKKKSTLDNPKARDAVHTFCRDCGHESYGKKAAWDCVGLSKAAYFAYKKANPAFAEQVESWKSEFYLLQGDKDVERLRTAWKQFDERLESGELGDRALTWYLERVLDAAQTY